MRHTGTTLSVEIGQHTAMFCLTEWYVAGQLGLMKRPRSKSALALKLTEKAQQGRYGLLVWLRENYADLTAARTELHLSFKQLAEAAADAGIKDAQGNAPKPWSVRTFF